MKYFKTKEKVIGVILIIIFLCVFYLTLDANKFKAVVHVVEGESVIGLNPTTERLDFGDLSRGTSAVRRVSIKNETRLKLPMRVAMFKLGGISGLMDIDKNFFKLKAGEEAEINFTVYMPASAEIDKIYDGRVYLFKIPSI